MDITKSAIQLYSIDEITRGAIISCLAGDAGLYNVLGPTLLKTTSDICMKARWMGIQNKPSGTKTLNEERIESLLHMAENKTTDDLIAALYSIGKDQYAKLVLQLCDRRPPAQIGVTAMPVCEPYLNKVSRKYETVGDIIGDEDNFGLIIMNLYLQLENLWPKSVEKFIESRIDVRIDANTISQKAMKGKFYLESIKYIKLSDFLSNLDSIDCALVKDIDAKLNELNNNVIREKKTSFSGQNEVASWCADNDLSHLYNQLLTLGFDSLVKLKHLDEQSCTEMGIKGYSRIELMKKINLLKN